MIGKKHPWSKHPCSPCRLFGSHGIRLIGRQKGNVDIFQVSHFLNILGVAGNVYSQSVKRKDVTVIAPLRMELRMPGSDVVGWHSFDLHVFGQLQLVAVTHYLGTSQLLGRVWIGDYHGSLLSQ